MTTRELLSRGYDYMSERAIDLNEMKSTAEYTEDWELIYTLRNEINGMGELLAYLQTILEMEEL